MRTLLFFVLLAAFASSMVREVQQQQTWKERALKAEGRLYEIDIVLDAWIDTDEPKYDARSRKLAVYELVRYRRQNPDPIWDKHAEWTKPSKIK